MISSNAQQETISFFLQTLKSRNPTIPAWFMTDKDKGQINSIALVYPDANILLCWWHVLHAWQQHFVTAHHPELWDLLKKWVRLTDENDFDMQWEKIKKIAPPSVIKYLEKDWLPDRNMWSAVARSGRKVWELGDTNMLLEV